MSCSKMSSRMFLLQSSLSQFLHVALLMAAEEQRNTFLWLHTHTRPGDVICLPAMLPMLVSDLRRLLLGTFLPSSTQLL